MTDKFTELQDVINRLVGEMVACTPQEWTKGTLTIETDGVRIDYKLKNEEQPGKAVISEKLRDLIDELYVRQRNHGEAWATATISFHQEGTDCKFNVNYTYPPKSGNAMSVGTKKPWWKFGRA